MNDTIVDSGSAASVRPWLAALLSFLYPGLGHVYLREWLRAVSWFVLALATGMLLIPPDLAMTEFSVQSVVQASEQIPLTGTLAMFAVTFLCMLDAYWLASRRRPTQPQGEEGASHQCPECGRELEPDLDFCHWCTARLEEETA